MIKLSLVASIAGLASIDTKLVKTPTDNLVINKGTGGPDRWNKINKKSKG